MQEEKQPIHVSVDEILRAKAGAKARFVPRFLVNYLKKIVHEDEINEYLSQTAGITGVPWLKETVKYFDMQVTVEGEENFPPDGDGLRYTFACNHPLGGPDGIAIGWEIGKRYGGKVKYILNDILTNLPGLKPLCVPVNKTGAQSRRSPQMINEGFAGNDNIVMFPAGLCSRRHKGVIRDLPWTKTFIVKSVATHRDVVPMHFSGRNSDRFYRIARACEVLHSPINFAMLFLADETYRNRHKSFTLKIGKPIPWQTFDKSRTPAQWASYVQDICYSL